MLARVAVAVVAAAALSTLSAAGTAPPAAAESEFAALVGSDIVRIEQDPTSNALRVLAGAREITRLLPPDPAVTYTLAASAGRVAVSAAWFDGLTGEDVIYAGPFAGGDFTLLDHCRDVGVLRPVAAAVDAVAFPSCGAATLELVRPDRRLALATRAVEGLGAGDGLFAWSDGFQAWVAGPDGGVRRRVTLPSGIGTVVAVGPRADGAVAVSAHPLDAGELCPLTVHVALPGKSFRPLDTQTCGATIGFAGDAVVHARAARLLPELTVTPLDGSAPPRVLATLGAGPFDRLVDVDGGNAFVHRATTCDGRGRDEVLSVAPAAPRPAALPVCPIGLAARPLRVSRDGELRLHLRCPRGCVSSDDGLRILAPAWLARNVAASDFYLVPGHSRVAPLFEFSAAQVDRLRRRGRVRATFVAVDVQGRRRTLRGVLRAR